MGINFYDWQEEVPIELRINELAKDWEVWIDGEDMSSQIHSVHIEAQVGKGRTYIGINGFDADERRSFRKVGHRVAAASLFGQLIPTSIMVEKEVEIAETT